MSSFHSLSPRHRVKLFVDVEFNGRNGKLLSLALAQVDGPAFYEVMDHSAVELIDWVQENVVPVFHKEPVSYGMFMDALETYLGQFAYVEFIYNAHADARYLKEALAQLRNKPLYQLQRDGFLNAAASKIPHNALADAEALIEQVYGSTTEGGHGVTDRDVILELVKVGIPLDRRDVSLNYVSDGCGGVHVTITPEVPRKQDLHGRITLFMVPK